MLPGVASEHGYVGSRMSRDRRALSGGTNLCSLLKKD